MSKQPRKQPSKTTPKKAAAKSAKVAKVIKDQDRLIMLSEAIDLAASRAEAQYWQVALDTLITTLVDGGSDKVLMDALNKSEQGDSHGATEILSESAEAVAQTCFFNVDNGGSTYQAMLFSIPMVAWSRYQIPVGQISDEAADAIYHGLSMHLIAPDVVFDVAPYLFSPDLIPNGFLSTRRLLQSLADAATNQERYRIPQIKEDDLLELPVDIRFIIGVAIAKLGQPIYRWQDLNIKSAAIARNECFRNWMTEARPLFSELMTGSDFELGLPNAFFHNLREADKRVRGHTLRTIFGLSQEALNAKPQELAAVVAGVGDGGVDEYRVSLLYKGQDDVINGVIWPLYGEENEDSLPLPIKAIEAILREQKIGEITTLDGLFKAEFCEDCGAPLFYNTDGEAVHAHMPGEGDSPNAHYH